MYLRIEANLSRSVKLIVKIRVLTAVQTCAEAHLHAFVDLDPAVVVVVQLLVDVPQRLQAETVGLAHARRHHGQTRIWGGGETGGYLGRTTFRVAS